MCLEDRKFRRLHDARSNEVETEILFLIAGGCTAAYMLKLFLVLFFKKPSKDVEAFNASGKKYLSKPCLVLLSIPALLIYLGYALGVDMSVVLCTMIGLKGILNAILLFVIQFVNLLLLFVFAIQMSKFCWQKNVFGNCLVCGKEGNIILFFLIVLSANSLILCLLRFVINIIFVF